MLEAQIATRLKPSAKDRILPKRVRITNNYWIPSESGATGGEEREEVEQEEEEEVKGKEGSLSHTLLRLICSFFPHSPLFLPISL